MKLVAYTRVSTEQQGASGLGLEAQKEAIQRYVNAHGHEIVTWCEDIISSRNEARPGWLYAVGLLEHGTPEGVIVAKLDRISRSVGESAQIFEEFKKKGWNIIALDLGVDTSTPAGKLVATVMMAVAEWERDVISQRTSEALQAKKANGEKLGRPYPGASEGTVAMISHLAKSGYGTWGNIANYLNGRNPKKVTWPTPSGKGKWHPSTVSRIARAHGITRKSTS